MSQKEFIYCIAWKISYRELVLHFVTNFEFEFKAPKTNSQTNQAGRAHKTHTTYTNTRHPAISTIDCHLSPTLLDHDCRHHPVARPPPPSADHPQDQLCILSNMSADADGGLVLAPESWSTMPSPLQWIAMSSSLPLLPPAPWVVVLLAHTSYRQVYHQCQQQQIWKHAGAEGESQFTADER